MNHYAAKARKRIYSTN